MRKNSGRRQAQPTAINKVSRRQTSDWFSFGARKTWKIIISLYSNNKGKIIVLENLTYHAREPFQDYFCLTQNIGLSAWPAAYLRNPLIALWKQQNTNGQNQRTRGKNLALGQIEDGCFHRKYRMYSKIKSVWNIHIRFCFYTAKFWICL